MGDGMTDAARVPVHVSGFATVRVHTADPAGGSGTAIEAPTWKLGAHVIVSKIPLTEREAAVAKESLSRMMPNTAKVAAAGSVVPMCGVPSPMNL